MEHFFLLCADRIQMLGHLHQVLDLDSRFLCSSPKCSPNFESTRYWGGGRSCSGTWYLDYVTSSKYIIFGEYFFSTLPVTTGCIPENAYQKFYTFTKVIFSSKQVSFMLHMLWIEIWAIAIMLICYYHYYLEASLYNGLVWWFSHWLAQHMVPRLLWYAIDKVQPELNRV